MTISGDARRTGRPASFDQKELVAAALRLSPEGLTLREVADSLEVPRTTVYNRVRNPQELGRMVVSALLEAAERRVPAPIRERPGREARRKAGEGSWERALEAFAVGRRDVLVAVGPWLRYFDPAVHVGPDSLEIADRLIAMMVKDGFDAEQAGRALSLVTSVINEAVRQHSLGLHRRGPEEYLTYVDAERFRWIVAARGISVPEREEEQFIYNLNCALAGIAAGPRRRAK